MDYRSKIQNSLDEAQDGYKLKTNDELIDIIVDFGCGKTEFHTADIERLIREHARMVEVLNIVTANLALVGTNLENEYRINEAIKLGDKTIKLYAI